LVLVVVKEGLDPAGSKGGETMSRHGKRSRLLEAAATAAACAAVTAGASPITPTIEFRLPDGSGRFGRSVYGMRSGA
jgi:hypothetical protein